jgi:DNA-directed RNA polymerase subunit beta'
VGRILFNSIIPDEIGYRNYTFGKRELGDLVFECFTGAGLGRTTEFLDGLKDFGFGYATQGGDQRRNRRHGGSAGKAGDPPRG